MTEDKEQIPPDETFTVLPWYVNASLSASEAEKVRLHLEHCMTCAAEVSTLNSLRRELLSAEENAPAAPADAFARIMNRIEVYEAARGGSPLPETSVTGWRDQLSALWTSWGRVAFATQLAALLVLIVVLVLTFQRARMFEQQAQIEKTRAEVSEQSLKEKQQRYETLAGENPASRAEGALLNVAFKEDATEKEIRTLLESINGTIVSGPSLQNIYVVELRDAKGEQRQHVLTAALRQLQSKPAIVLFSNERR